MSCVDKKPDFKTRCKAVSEHASWVKEWDVSGFPNSWRYRSIGRGSPVFQCGCGPMWLYIVAGMTNGELIGSLPVRAGSVVVGVPLPLLMASVGSMPRYVLWNLSNSDNLGGCAVGDCLAFCFFTCGLGLQLFPLLVAT